MRGALKDSTATARKLLQSERIVVASTQYLARHRAPNTPSDLLAHETILYAQSVGGDEWHFRRGSAETSVRVASRLSFTAAEGVREAVIAGFGLAIVSRWMMAPELASEAVLPVLTDWSLPPLDLWAVFPTGRLPSAKARAFVTWFESAAE